MLLRKGTSRMGARTRLKAVTMRYSRISVLALAGLMSVAGLAALAQGVAPRAAHPHLCQRLAILFAEGPLHLLDSLGVGRVEPGARLDAQRRG